MCGKRVIVFEELDPSKHFNQDILKELTGGVNTKVTARGLYADSNEYTWTAKVIIAFNGEFPYLA